MISHTKLILVCVLLLAGGGLEVGGSPLAVAGTSVPSESTSANTEYRLHHDDVISVCVYGEDDLTCKARVNENGEVVLPLLSPLKVGGTTIQEANARIREAYKADYLVNPVVTVSIVEYGNSKVSVLGQVRNPGVYQFPSNEKLNLLQALALAGGYTRIGAPSRVTIKRMVNGHTIIIRLDAKAMAETEKTAIFEVYPDDVINVGETIF